jgi:hypothetical protein
MMGFLTPLYLLRRAAIVTECRDLSWPSHCAAEGGRSTHMMSSSRDFEAKKEEHQDNSTMVARNRVALLKFRRFR